MQSDAFADLYRAYVQRVLNYMRVRVGDQMLAEDLTAATFERAFAKLGQLRQPEAFGAWLFSIARNEVYQHFRRQLRGADPLPLSAGGLRPDDGPPPDVEAARRQELDEILRAIRQLSDREQEVIRLKFVGGLTNRSIAGALRLSQGHVAVILYRAMAKLRDMLDFGVPD